jgi:hypothetical protein
VAGPNDWNGWYLGYGHTPAVFPGADFTFIGEITRLLGVTGPAICERFDLVWGPATGQLIEYRIFFAADGALTIGVTGDGEDTSSPNPPTSACMKIELDGVEILDLTEFSMSIRARNTPYVTSTTCSDTKRVAGPIDAEMQFTYLEGDMVLAENTHAIDDVKEAKLYVTDSTYWHLADVIVDRVSVNPDHMSPTPVAVTVHASFSGWTAGAQGAIVNPADTDKWGGT